MEKLSQNSLKQIDEIVALHRLEKGPVKLMLHDVQHQLGYIPFEAMEKIADATNTSMANVYGVVTFYTQFTTEPKGKHVVNVCMGTACYVRGAKSLLDMVQELTKSPVNGTSDDGLFSLDATRCLGACGLAPIAIIDGRVFGNANESSSLEDEIRSIIAHERID